MKVHKEKEKRPANEQRLCVKGNAFSMLKSNSDSNNGRLQSRYTGRRNNLTTSTHSEYICDY